VRLSTSPGLSNRKWHIAGAALAVVVVASLAVVGATKIVCDYVDPLRGFGAGLGD
jgi:hypothetical protein